MPSRSKNAGDESRDSALAETVEAALSNVAVSTVPVMIVGVNRRCSLGNFEHIDIYAGIALPMTGSSLEDPEALSLAVKDAAEVGFRETSRETFDRYMLIKDATNPRKEEPEKG